MDSAACSADIVRSRLVIRLQHIVRTCMRRAGPPTHQAASVPQCMLTERLKPCAEAAKLPLCALHQAKQFITFQSPFRGRCRCGERLHGSKLSRCELAGWRCPTFFMTEHCEDCSGMCVGYATAKLCYKCAEKANECAWCWRTLSKK